jgi:para-nitrobenzyl esterase
MHAAGTTLLAAAVAMLWAALAAPACGRLAEGSADEGPVAATALGRVRGTLVPGGGAAFRGVPFAAPPVGPLRWQPPAPVAAWGDVRPAVAFGPPCPQPVLGDWNRADAERGREDCLYLNVHTPAWPSTTRLPVMVWVHGGGNSGGTGSTDFFAEGQLPRHGVVLVTVNYRLGVLGFFAHPSLTRESEHRSSGNYALLDQIAALRWVRDHIAAFGGDPANVTLFGQSAGAIDGAALAASPLARGLFHKAISQSGSITRHPTPLADLEKSGEAWTRSLPVPAGQDSIAWLRGLSADALLAAVAGSEAKLRPQVEQALDPWVLPTRPAQAFFAGRQAPIPMIVGHTSRELPMHQSADELRLTIGRGVPAAQAPGVLAAYGLADGGRGLADDPVLGPLSVQFIVDVQFRCTAVLQLAWLEASRQAGYGYQFDRPVKGREAEGALHSGELFHVFGSFATGRMIGGAYDDADRRLSDTLQRYWTNFARSGDPNGPGLPPWPRFGTGGSFIEFLPDAGTAVRPRFRKTQCDAFRAVVEAEQMYAKQP